MGGLAIAFVCGAVLGVVLGLAMGIALCWKSVKLIRQKNRELRTIINGEARLARPETMKRFVWACVINGFAWVWCSYILAYLDKPQIAEELSKVALVEIIVPVAVYALKSVVENLSKNNRWPDKGNTLEDTQGDQEPPEGGAAG